MGMSLRVNGTNRLEEEEAVRKPPAARRREQQLKTRLPSPPPSPSIARQNARQERSWFGVRKLLWAQLYVSVYAMMHAVFSVYMQLRIAYHAVVLQAAAVLGYHHRTPDFIRRDVGKLPRSPRHLSVILTLEDGGRGGDALEKLVNQASEVAAWCACADIPMLSIYEKTGILKRYMPQMHRKMSHELKSWFGKGQAPFLSLYAPHQYTINPPIQAAQNGIDHQEPSLAVMLIDVDDGRESIVTLTKVLTEMVQKSKISAEDITSEVIDSELSHAVMGEPDLLIAFSSYVDLQGYPPWQIRLTEIYHAPDTSMVSYQVFLRGLQKYAAATFKLGK